MERDRNIFKQLSPWRRKQQKKESESSEHHSVTHYGRVKISGEAQAHLGDMVLSGPISVQQLNLSMKKEFADITPIQVQLSPNDIILRALNFRENSYREGEIKPAHQQSFNWIFSEAHSNFSYWLSSGSGIYWINGKAGSGKSTLMKFLANHIETKKHLVRWSRSKYCIEARFFFWHRGTQLQKSYEGFLRSVLHQVLTQRPDLISSTFPNLYPYLINSTQHEHFELTLPELQSGMELLFTNMPNNLSIFLVLDGVDEFADEQFGFCRFLVQISTHPFLKMLVSSRPTPECHRTFSKYSTLTLQDLTVRDIANYVSTELLQDTLFIEMNQREPGFANEVERALIDKASGVFLWVHLVVKDLLIGLSDYEDRASLMTRIRSLPGDLELPYGNMFANINSAHRREGALLIQLIDRALHVQQHLGGLMALQVSLFDLSASSHTNVTEVITLSPQEKVSRIKTIEGQLRSRCCGLVEVRWSGPRLGRPPDYEAVTRDLDLYAHVDYIHHTVADYLEQQAIKEELRSAHEIDTEGLDIIILSSYAAMLKNMLSNVTAPSEALRLKTEARNNLFAAAVGVSLRLHYKGDTRYVAFLESVDSVCLQHSLATTNKYMLYTWFWARFSIGEYPERSQRCDVAMYFIAQAGLSAFWRRKIRTCSEASYSRTGVLIQLLSGYSDVEHHRVELVALYEARVQNIEALLEITDPNNIASDNDNIWNVELEQNTTYLQDYEPHMFSPWQYWLSREECHCDFESRITAAFIKAGARLGKSNVLSLEPKEAFSRNLVKHVPSQREHIGQRDGIKQTSSKSTGANGEQTLDHFVHRSRVNNHDHNATELHERIPVRAHAQQERSNQQVLKKSQIHFYRRGTEIGRPVTW